jgi:hypothetical protein
MSEYQDYEVDFGHVTTTMRLSEAQAATYGDRARLVKKAEPPKDKKVPAPRTAAEKPTTKTTPPPTTKTTGRRRK